MLDVPVAFIVFNRPDLTRRTYAAIRRAQPKNLCIISDGPRPDRVGEADLVRQSREIAESCDWACDVSTFYSEINLGCGRRVSSGISGVFEQHERAIIIEDDCEVGASFFEYCSALLDRYSEDRRVMAVSGDNFHHNQKVGDASYYFSKYPHCWGWASWRRAWQHYDHALESWPVFRESQNLAALCDNFVELDYWTRMFDAVHEGRIDTWDFTWTLACWMNHGLTAIPNVNLVSNLGFGVDATHTLASSQFAELPIGQLGPLVHPDCVSRSYAADKKLDLQMFSRGKLRPRHLIRLGKNWSKALSRAA
ncbi:MAG: glycosyltransferase family 2 protein [Rubripirellula sp.]